MKQVTVDEVLRAKLLGLREPVQLCDSYGVVGQFIPAVNPADYERWEPPIDEAEMRRRRESNERRFTTAEVQAYLRSQGKK